VGQHPLKPVDEWLKHAEGIDDALLRHELDSIVAPTGGVAWLTDLVNGAH
jgi:amidase